MRHEEGEVAAEAAQFSTDGTNNLGSKNLQPCTKDLT